MILGLIKKIVFKNQQALKIVFVDRGKTWTHITSRKTAYSIQYPHYVSIYDQSIQRITQRLTLEAFRLIYSPRMECLRGGFRRTISAFNTLRLSLFCRLSGGKKKTPTRYINWRAVEGRCRRRHSDVKFLRISSDRGKCPHTRARARKLLPHLPPRPYGTPTRSHRPGGRYHLPVRDGDDRDRGIVPRQPAFYRRARAPPRGPSVSAHLPARADRKFRSPKRTARACMK